MAVVAHPWFLILAIATSFYVVSSDEIALVVGQPMALEIVPSYPVRDSPGSKPGTVVGTERVHIHGLSRMKNLKRYCNALNVKVSFSNSSVRQPNTEVCLHRNYSIALGNCSRGQWQKLSKGSWVRTMSPFDHRLLDVRTVGVSTAVFEVTLQEEFLMYRLVLLILGIVLMALAPTLSKSLVFYYGSAMTVGIIVVILVVLYQGMKLLPTGRRNSLAFFLYSSIAGVGTFILSYLSTFSRAVLVQIGVGEDMYNPLAIFLLLFIVLLGAWMGFWAVQKLILTEDGSIDTSVALLVTWSIRSVAAAMILQSSLDALLATLALICTAVVLMLLHWVSMPKVLRQLQKKLRGPAESSFWENVNYDSSPSGFLDGDFADRFHMSGDKVLRARSGQSPYVDYDSSRPGFPSGEYTDRFHMSGDKVVGGHSNKWEYAYYESSPSGFPNGEYADRFRVSGSQVLRARPRQSSLTSCNSSGQASGLAKPTARRLSDYGSYFSTFHRTPERKKLSKEEWDKLTRDHTKKALEELVSSPDFSRWAVSNAEKITLTPVKKNQSAGSRWKGLFHW